VLDAKQTTPRLEHPDSLLGMVYFSGICRSQGRFDETYDLLRRALELQERVLGPEHQDTVATRNSLERLARFMSSLPLL
jgi:hypothetical protein